jgi:hypothetical protein
MYYALALLHSSGLAFSTTDAVHVILFLALAGVLLWLLFRYVPMQPPFPTLIMIVVIICIVLWLLSRFGMM